MFDSRRCLGALGFVLALTACGGGAFTSADEGAGATGNGGRAGSSGKLPPGATGGGIGIDEPPSSGGTGSIDPGDVIEPGDTGGAPGMVGGGQSGAGVVEPEPEPEPMPIELDLTECGADAFGTGIEPTLYSTLDDAEAITEPAIGELGFVSNAEEDYHGGQCGTGINIDQPGDYVKYHYQDNGVVHYSTLVGAMDFWYLPSYSHTDGLNHHLFSSANWATAGGFRIRKAAANNENAFQVIVASTSLEPMEISVPADAYELVPNQWARITLVWYLATELEQRYVRLYLDGKLAGELVPENTFVMNPDLGGYFVFGVWDFGDPEHAAGILDDLKVFGRGP